MTQEFDPHRSILKDFSGIQQRRVLTKNPWRMSAAGMLLVRNGMGSFSSSSWAMTEDVCVQHSSHRSKSSEELWENALFSTTQNVCVCVCFSPFCYRICYNNITRVNSYCLQLFTNQWEEKPKDSFTFQSGDIDIGIYLFTTTTISAVQKRYNVQIQ